MKYYEISDLGRITDSIAKTIYLTETFFCKTKKSTTAENWFGYPAPYQLLKKTRYPTKQIFRSIPTSNPLMATSMPASTKPETDSPSRVSRNRARSMLEAWTLTIYDYPYMWNTTVNASQTLISGYNSAYTFQINSRRQFGYFFSRPPLYSQPFTRQIVCKGNFQRRINHKISCIRRQQLHRPQTRVSAPSPPWRRDLTGLAPCWQPPEI